MCPCGPMDKASAYEAGDCGFDPRQGLYFAFSSITTTFSFHRTQRATSHHPNNNIYPIFIATENIMSHLQLQVQTHHSAYETSFTAAHSLEYSTKHCILRATLNKDPTGTMESWVPNPFVKNQWDGRIGRTQAIFRGLNPLKSDIPASD